MKDIDNTYFDICEFIYSDDVREIVISLKGDLLRVGEVRVGDSDVWIVPSGKLASALEGLYKSVYPMFFGILLEALHRHHATVPIYGIYFRDVDRSFENGEGNFHRLIEEIASDKYKSGRG
ncbi:hypothetical protein [Burkholderia sp. WAC0059]|uniref:hypothetical protein n=1 Tax=Burkholderia sp. WAC0059 TaxID=2066022 RepID=UPI0011AF9939|nr:hypothetical protein [Burkholderia sp. WAC0059]